ncbi:MAG: DoxX family protein [Chthoniobacterales bacterium]
MSFANFFSYSDPWFLHGALLFLRLFLGICFVVHGLGKLGIVGPGNLSGFTGWLKSLGFPWPALQARAAMLTELLGGALIAAGLFTRVAALGCCFTMLIAVIFGHKDGGYLITNNPPGNEYALNLALLMMVLILLGPGHYSLDFFFFAKP